MTDQPIRTCVSCGKKAFKFDLLRHGWGDDRPVPDERQVQTGRGVYTCRNETCKNRFYANSRRWKRLFRRT
ncbi:MAG: DUF448 domain-containing protein [Desulfofustis sp.]|nr:DUF448 domain-containing protein [Desulfofustis sp.]